ncbi:MAG: porin family protein [Prolixibacteraceae bacterium]|nr:porin family protein [Prolixibacteraceae bacterium]
MKTIIISSIFVLFSFTLAAQPVFDLGVRAGFNNSKITVNVKEINQESVVKAHAGVYGRLGWSRVYLQPEVYFISKGGELFDEGGFLDKATTFDFNNIDVPLLLGIKVLKGEKANLRIMAGPVFSFVISGDTSGDPRIDDDYFRDHYFGYQYGIGIDFWKFFIDARIEEGSNNLYQHPSLDFDGKNRTFMLTAGLKIF